MLDLLSMVFWVTCLLFPKNIKADTGHVAQPAGTAAGGESRLRCDTYINTPVKEVLLWRDDEIMEDADLSEAAS